MSEFDCIWEEFVAFAYEKSYKYVIIVAYMKILIHSQARQIIIGGQFYDCIITTGCHNRVISRSGHLANFNYSTEWW